MILQIIERMPMKKILMFIALSVSIQADRSGSKEADCRHAKSRKRPLFG